MFARKIVDVRSRIPMSTFLPCAGPCAGGPRHTASRVRPDTTMRPSRSIGHSPCGCAATAASMLPAELLSPNSYRWSTPALHSYGDAEREARPPMNRVNQNDLPWIERRSPQGKFHQFRRNLSPALAADAAAPALPSLPPFEVELMRLPSGAANFP